MSAANALKPPRQVLLADDDASVLLAFGQELVESGFDVTTAADGVEALTVSVEQAWDAVLVDARLPSRPGLEVLRALRSQPGNATLPVFLLVRPGDEDATDAAVREGANGVFDVSRLAPKDLVAALAKALETPRPGLADTAAPTVPPEVAAIAARFRKAGSPAVAIPPVAAAPAPAAPNAVPRPGRESWEGDDPPSPAAAPAPAARPAKRVGSFDVVVNQVSGQAMALARALGMSVDYTCAECTAPLVLRLTPDPNRKLGVMGGFVCRRCNALGAELPRRAEPRSVVRAATGPAPARITGDPAGRRTR